MQRRFFLPFAAVFCLLLLQQVASLDHTTPHFNDAGDADADLISRWRTMRMAENVDEDHHFGRYSGRMLASTSTYISYGSLTANRVPCSTAGASYYNCVASGPANPYTRSCTAITQCSRDTSR